MSDASRDEGDEGSQPVTLLKTPVSLQYNYSAGQSASRFLRAIESGKLLGQRSGWHGQLIFTCRGRRR